MTFSKLLFQRSYSKAGLLLVFILVAEFMSFNSLALQISDSVESTLRDSIVYYEFDGSNYRASSYNYMSATDDNGIVYFGNENGLLEFDGTHWQLYKTPKFTPVKYLEIFGDKIFVFGNNELGYYQRDSTGNMIYHSLNDKRPDDKQIPFITNIIQRNGNMYFGLDSAILKWDGEIIKRINTGTSMTMFEVNSKILVSLFGEDGGLAVMEDDSLSIVNPNFTFENDYAWEILKYKNDEWLIFTSENGAFTLDPETYQTKPWNNQANDYFKNDSTFIYFVEKISDSLFISSTWQNGMQIFNYRGEILKMLNEKNGLIGNYYTHPAIDRRGNIWLSSSFGIQYLQFYKPNEKFLFQPSAKIRYIKSGDSSIFIRDTSHSIVLTEERANSIDFYFSAPSFFEEDLQFSYYLEGFDEEWSEWTTNSRKEYTNLPGGQYTMHLKAKHTDLDNIEIIPFKFGLEIPKPWYRYSISYVLFVLIVGLVIFGFIRVRTHRLSLANKKLEATVKERTSELRSQKERLKEANEELKTINNELDNFVYRSSHDLVAPLKSLRGLISVAGMSEDPNEIKDYFRLMNISINKLEEFIKSIMDFSTNTKKPLEMRPVGMDDILDSIVEDLKFYENAEKVELIRAYDSDFKIKTDPKRLNIVLSNLVTNALKYHDFKKDEPPYIRVSAKVENSSYVIEVEDNGSGIAQEHQSKIFEMFFRANQGTEGSGLGLYIVVDTLNVLKGKIELISKVRKGTTFKVTLPLVD